MAFASSKLDLIDMVKLHTNRHRMPLLFFVDGVGVAIVSSLSLTIRFGLQTSSIWIECKILDPLKLMLFYTITKATTH